MQTAEITFFRYKRILSSRTTACMPVCSVSQLQGGCSESWYRPSVWWYEILLRITNMNKESVD